MNLDGIPVLCHWCYPRSWLWKLWMKHFIQGPKICRAQALGFSFLLDRAGTAHPIFFFLCCFFLSCLLSSSSEVIIQRSPRKCLVVSERGNCSEAQVQMSSIILDSMSSDRPQLPAGILQTQSLCLFIYTARPTNSQVINLYKHQNKAYDTISEK